VSEFVWATLFVYVSVVGGFIDEAAIFTLNIVVLALASAELAIGFLLLRLFYFGARRMPDYCGVVKSAVVK